MSAVGRPFTDDGNLSWRRLQCVVPIISGTQSLGWKITLSSADHPSVSPNVYTSLSEIDRFADAKRTAAIDGI